MVSYVVRYWEYIIDGQAKKAGESLRTSVGMVKIEVASEMEPRSIAFDPKRQKKLGSPGIVSDIADNCPCAGSVCKLDLRAK
jgi:hypothetical protein